MRAADVGSQEHLEVIKVLLNLSPRNVRTRKVVADLSLVDEAGSTVLFYARNISILKTLIANGAEPGAINKAGDNILINLAKRCQLQGLFFEEKVFAYLLGVEGVDPNHKNNDHFTVAYYCNCPQGKKKVLPMLMMMMSGAGAPIAASGSVGGSSSGAGAPLVSAAAPAAAPASASAAPGSFAAAELEKKARRGELKRPKGQASEDDDSSDLDVVGDDDSPYADAELARRGNKKPRSGRGWETNL